MFTIKLPVDVVQQFCHLLKIVMSFEHAEYVICFVVFSYVDDHIVFWLSMTQVCSDIPLGHIVSSHPAEQEYGIVYNEEIKIKRL